MTSQLWKYNNEINIDILLLSRRGQLPCGDEVGRQLHARIEFHDLWVFTSHPEPEFERESGDVEEAEECVCAFRVQVDTLYDTVGTI